MAEREYITREIFLSKILNLHTVMSNSCVLQIRQRIGEGIDSFLGEIQEYPIEFNPRNGDYYFTLNDGNHYSIKPEDFGLQENEWLYISFTNPADLEFSINKFLELPIRYEDKVVKVF